MRTLHSLLLLAVLVAPVAAQSVRWVPGLDIIVPAYRHLTDKGEPGAVTDRIGYDRDTHTATRLHLPDQCYTQWSWAPTPGQGAITGLIQISYNVFALYHESGLLRVDYEADSLYCRPLQ